MLNKFEASVRKFSPLRVFSIAALNGFLTSPRTVNLVTERSIPPV